MKIIVIDSGLGGKDFIEKIKKINKNIKCEFVKPFENMITTYNKQYVRDTMIKLLQTYSYQNVHSIVIACHSISSCILDILMENSFVINKIIIYDASINITAIRYFNATGNRQSFIYM